MTGTGDGLAEAVLALERSGRLDDALAMIQATTFTPDSAVALVAILHRDGAWHSAFRLAVELANASVRPPLLLVGLLHLAAHFERDDVFAAAAAWWRPFADDESARRLGESMLETLAATPVAQAFLEGDRGRLERYLTLCTLLSPELAEIFSPGRRPARSVRQPDLPPPRPLPATRRRIVVCSRRRFYGEGSRLHELGPRISESFRRAGFDVIEIPIEAPIGTANHAAAIGEVRRLAREAPLDAWFHDELGLHEDCDRDLDGVEEAIADIRRASPAVRIVSMCFDPWAARVWDRQRRIVAALDHAWTTMPAVPLWSEPVFAGKVIGLPFPMAGLYAHVEPPPPSPCLRFAGSVAPFNYHRAFWLTLAPWAGIALETLPSDHQDDGEPSLRSSASFLSRLCGTGTVLSLSMRADGRRVMTGRCLEAVLSGALLVQEETEDLDAFLVPDEHYLAFRSLGDLEAIARRLEAEPAWGRAVAASGTAFARRHYSDESVIAGVAHRLWGADG